MYESNQRTANHTENKRHYSVKSYYSLKKKEIMKKYICEVCGYIYDPAIGDPDSGIEPGTAFEDIPEDWVCPICGVGKDDFKVEE